MASEVGSFVPYAKDITEPKSGSVFWTKKLETGIDVLDEQHRQYFDLLSAYLKRATEYTETNKKASQLTESLDFLRRYAEEHFSTEETIMKDAEYLDYSPHLEEHLHFLSHVGELHKDMEVNGFSSKLSREVNYYIVEWFMEHILVSDMQLVEIIKAKDWKG